jgi:RNA polymerase-binding transcription factor DksA
MIGGARFASFVSQETSDSGDATMTAAQLEKYRLQLEALSSDVRESVSDATEQTRQPTGGQADGGLSNAPMHLADLGTETYLQELNSTVMEAEQALSDEITAARQRIDAGTFGTCERCSQPIAEARLDALPYVRYCVQCAAAVEEGDDAPPVANLNKGRPQRPEDTLANRVSQGTEPSEERLGVQPDPSKPDSEAGTAGGGTAVGGLAGTNVGAGDPADVDLDRATGSGDFSPESAEAPNSRYSGRAGGAVRQ